VYVLDMTTGVPLDSLDVGNDGLAENQDGCPPEGCERLKNAVQADPLPEEGDQRSILSVYAGDLDGRLWRFSLASAPATGFGGPPRLLFSGGGAQPIFGSIARLAGSGGQSYLFFGTGSDLLPSRPGTAGHRLVGLAEMSAGATPRFERVLRTAAAGGVDEGVTGSPVVAGSVVFFATTARVGGGCESQESSVYALTVSGGAAYDVNADHRRDGADSPVVSRLRVGRATPPVVADRHLFVATGDRVQIYGDPDGFGSAPPPGGVRILSWREVRRP
jgi:Tfp pilus tip-associated adhesin PilY1